MRRWISVLALLLSACAPAYDGGPLTTTTRPEPPDQSFAELESARARWAALGASDYTYQFTDDCGECDPARREPRRIAVLDGSVLTVAEEDLRTVEDVFASIEQALDEGRDVEVIYDAATGLPQDVQIDMDLRLVDGGTHWILDGLTDLTPIDSAEELREARRRWDARQIDDYRFLMRVECDCPESGAFDVKVVDDRIVEVTPLDLPEPGISVTPVTINQTFDDLEEWFTDTKDLIDEGILEVDIRVDPVLGYPRWVYVRAEFVDDGETVPFTAVVTIDLLTPLDSQQPPPVPDPDDLQALDEARRLWMTSGPADYRYTLTIHCMCPEEYVGPFEITVRDRVVVAATWKGKPLAPGQGMALPVEEVFELIEEGIASGVDVDVTYHPVFGHPQQAIIDTEAVAVDGGLAFTIDNLIPIDKTGGVGGQVLAGPTCPVQKDPPDLACADRPVPGAVLVVLDAGGREVTRVVSNDNGYFEVSLEPGSYRFEPQPVEGLLGTAPPFEVDVLAGLIEQVSVSYDTGIR